MKSYRFLVGGILSGLVLAVAMSASAGDSSGFKGTVIFSGPVPAAVVVKTNSDPACQQLHPNGIASEDYVVGKNGGLKNVFVYVKQGLEGKSFAANTTTAKLNQSGCQYVPHVVGVQVNQPLEIANSDPTLHNINAQPKINKPFNIAQPIQGMKTLETFTKPEFIPLICNVHPWMKAIVGVFSNPYFAISGSDGEFQIKNLPAGDYVIAAWHEKLGTAEQSISIKAGEEKTVTFTFKKS